MAQLLLDNVPTELLEEIQQQAERERKSMQEQVVYLLRQALDTPRSFTQALEKFRKMYPTTSEEDTNVFEGLREKDMGREVEL